MEAALTHLGSRLDIPMERYVRLSEVLKHVLYQRTFDDYPLFDGDRLRLPTALP